MPKTEDGVAPLPSTCPVSLEEMLAEPPTRPIHHDGALLALLRLVAAPSLSPAPPQARALPPWFYGVDCYTEAPAIGAALRPTDAFDVDSSFGLAASDQDCMRLIEMLMRLLRGSRRPE